MDYKYVNKYLNSNKNKKTGKFRKFLSIIISQLLICVILFLIGIIILKYDKNNGNEIHKYLYEKNINFASINKWYKDHFGDITLFDSIINNDMPVFNENIKYNSSNIYKDGVKLEVDSNYLVPILDDGVVVFVGEKDDYGNTVIVQQTNGIYTWYGNISNLNVNIYDYVNKGEFLGEADGILYLVFQDEDGFVDYKKYLQ